MMRNIAGSVFRFGWAMGMLGVDQAANLLDRERGWRRSTDSLDAISSAATEHLGPTARRIFEAGDHLQSGLIDSAVHAARGLSGQDGGGLAEARGRIGETFDGLRRDLGRAEIYPQNRSRSGAPERAWDPGELGDDSGANRGEPDST